MECFVFEIFNNDIEWERERENLLTLTREKETQNVEIQKRDAANFNNTVYFLSNEFC